MQPRNLAIIITVLPLLACNGAFLLSAYQGLIPWCVPYLDGCSSISRAARSGNAIYFFRMSMTVYCVLLIWFWMYTKNWLDLLHGHSTRIARLILWLGIVGMFSLIVYIEFLGTTGEVNRFMRRTGIMIYFTLTPLSQLLLLNQHYKILHTNPEAPLSKKTLQFQLVVLILMLIIAVISVLQEATQTKSDASENIVEWNFSLLMTLYYAGMFFIWKDYKHVLINANTKK
jgi:hypothetical protein